jgi:sugar O-acyltransferase (sialic acid O-acetyltransferase NeuD family)
MGASRDLPADCQRIIIVGAGGFGREVLHWATDAWPEHREKIAGFLSNDPTVLEGKNCLLSIISSPEDFEPSPGDYFVLAIGIPGARRTVTEGLLARGCRFLTLIHPTAIVAPTASIHEGAVVCPYAIVSDAVKVSRFALLNYHTSLGHDASVGDFSVLSPYATLGGAAMVADDGFLGLHASIVPARSIGRRSQVSANSSVMHDVPGDSLVYGVPGKTAPLVNSVAPFS